MADDHHELIIVKRHDDGEHEHHSSAWKVAHADFMTAMMAFFLIMWLINVTDKDTRKAVANYFNPVNLASSITDIKGLNDPEQTVAKSKPVESDKRAPAKAGGNGGGGGGGGGNNGNGNNGDDKEQAAFRDPYATLKKLADEAGARAGGAAGDGVGDIGSRGTGNGDLNRDPFDPASWRTEPAQQTQADKPNSGKSQPATQRRPEAAARAESDQHSGEARPIEDRAMDAIKATAAPQQKPDEALESEIRKVVEAIIGTKHAPEVKVRSTASGIVVDLADDIDYSVFPVGSAVPDARFVRAMAQIAAILKSRPGSVSIRGHTDARPFRSDNYDNWRLSSARAQMALYMLVRGGLDEKRVARIEGVADRELKNTADPNAAENRRIEILLRSSAP